MLLTVGHSTHRLEELVALLRGAGVEAVADVRRYPGSRRHPWLARESLARELPDAALAYVHFEALGGRRPVAPGSSNGGWENRAFQGYADHMATAEFVSALGDLRALAADRRTAVMCAEAPWWRCHRRLLADALVVRGEHVRHLGPDGRLTDHELTPFAVVDHRTVTYPPAQGELLGR